MSFPFAVLCDDIISIIFEYLHIIELYQHYNKTVSKAFSIYCLRAMQKIQKISLFIDTTKCQRENKGLIAGFDNKWHSVTTDNRNIIFNIYVKSFIKFISLKIFTIIIVDWSFPLTIDISNVSQIVWSYPQNHVKFLPYVSALKWLSICGMNEIMWDLIAVYCPTLEVLITINSNISAIWWDPININTLSLKTMTNLLVLSVSKNISFKLINNFILSCPQLSHLMIDAKCTSYVDWESRVLSKRIQTVVLPPNLICFGISSDCSKLINVDFRRCKQLKILNIPLLYYSSHAISISNSFKRFIQSKIASEIFIFFHQYETNNILSSYNSNIPMSSIVNILKQPVLGASLKPVVPLLQVTELFRDNCLVCDIMELLFHTSQIKFIKPNDIKATFIQYLTSKCNNTHYVKLIENACNSEVVTATLSPLFILNKLH